MCEGHRWAAMTDDDGLAALLALKVLTPEQSGGIINTHQTNRPRGSVHVRGDGQGSKNASAIDIALTTRPAHRQGVSGLYSYVYHVRPGQAGGDV